MERSIPRKMAHLARAAGALSDSNFRLLWLSSVLSLAPRSMEAMVLAWVVLELTDSPFHVALVGVFGWTPLLTLGVVGGALADSLDRKRLFTATLAVNLATTLVLAVVLYAGWIQVWHAYAGILVTGSCYALGMASRRSLIHDIVGRERVTNAVALDTLGGNASAMLGPALAGFLIIAGGAAAGYSGALRLPVRVSAAVVEARVSAAGGAASQPGQHGRNTGSRAEVRGRTEHAAGDGADCIRNQPDGDALREHDPGGRAGRAPGYAGPDGGYC